MGNEPMHWSYRDRTRGTGLAGPESRDRILRTGLAGPDPRAGLADLPGCAVSPPHVLAVLRLGLKPGPHRRDNRGMSAAATDVLRQRATAAEDRASGAILDAAAVRRIELELPYAGAVTPPEAWQLFTRQEARLVDVRSAAEVHYVGRVPRALHVEWRGADAEPLARFLATLRTLVGADEAILFLCRSGVRSHHAALAAQSAGFAQAYNVLEGFEGQRNHVMQRGLIDGWRRHGLPWEQD